MGRDKALLIVEGEPMVRRVVRALRVAGARRVVAVGGDRARITAALSPAEPGEEAVIAVADDAPGEGPLGGIVTALGVLTSDIVLVVACDLLAPSSGAMAATVAVLAADPDSDVAVPTRGPQSEWLHAAWRQTAREPLVEALAVGERAVHRAGAALTVSTVPGLDPAALADADSPHDLPG